ncbi:hypothetical protein LTR94_037666, partial [Friedmanniomyces endolithicus]
AAAAAGRRRAHRQPVDRPDPRLLPGLRRLCGGQGGGRDPERLPGARTGQPRHRGQHGGAGRDRDRFPGRR